MTDVAGLPGPFARLSSLLMKVRVDTSVVDGSRLKVRCDMAQALDIPIRTRMITPGWLARSHFGFPSSRSPLPAGSALMQASRTQYGSGPDTTQARRCDVGAPRLSDSRARRSCRG